MPVSNFRALRQEPSKRPGKLKSQRQRAEQHHRTFNSRLPRCVATDYASAQRAAGCGSEARSGYVWNGDRQADRWQCSTVLLLT